jgi:hypothetical protein
LLAAEDTTLQLCLNQIHQLHQSSKKVDTEKEAEVKEAKKAKMKNWMSTTNCDLKDKHLDSSFALGAALFMAEDILKTQIMGMLPELLASTGEMEELKKKIPNDLPIGGCFSLWIQLQKKALLGMFWKYFPMAALALVAYSYADARAIGLLVYNAIYPTAGADTSLPATTPAIPDEVATAALAQAPNAAHVTAMMMASKSFRPLSLQNSLY